MFVKMYFLLMYRLKNIFKFNVGHKNTKKFFHHNFKKSDPILISFGTNIPDTTAHQMTV